MLITLFCNNTFIENLFSNNRKRVDVFPNESISSCLQSFLQFLRMDSRVVMSSAICFRIKFDANQLVVVMRWSTVCSNKTVNQSRSNEIVKPYAKSFIVCHSVFSLFNEGHQKSVVERWFQWNL